MKHPERPWNPLSKNESYQNAKKKRLEREFEELRKKNKKKKKQE